MTYSTDLRWRAIVFHYLYSLNTKTITALLGCSEWSIRNWINMFEKSGNVEPLQRRNRTRWPQEVLSFVETYTKEHPCFYIEELHNLGIILNKIFPMWETFRCPQFAVHFVLIWFNNID
jgi:transposase